MRCIPCKQRGYGNCRIGHMSFNHVGSRSPDEFSHAVRYSVAANLVAARILSVAKPRTLSSE